MTACRIVLGLAATLCLAASAIGAPVRFPLRVSENVRYLVDQDGQPFLVHGDSPWESVWRLTREEMAECERPTATGRWSWRRRGDEDDP